MPHRPKNSLLFAHENSVQHLDSAALEKRVDPFIRYNGQDDFFYAIMACCGAGRFLPGMAELVRGFSLGHV